MYLCRVRMCMSVIYIVYKGKVVKVLCARISAVYIIMNGCVRMYVYARGGMVRIWCDPDIKRVLKKIGKRV